MSFLSFSKKKKEGGVSLLIDIGNGSITGSFVLFEKNKKPKFLYTKKKPLSMKGQPSPLKLFDGMNAFLDTLVQTMMKEGFEDVYWKGLQKKINSVAVSLSSPWFVLKTKEVRVVKEQEYTITKSFIDSVVADEEELFRKELSEKYGSGPEESFSIVDRNFVHAKINGYDVNEYIGKKTKDFEMNICITAVGKTLEEKIVNIILKNTHIERNRISMYAFPVVLFSMVRDGFADESNFMIMDITNEITDVSVIKNDVITETASFPCGRNFIINQIAKASEVSTEIALSSVYMYMLNKVHDSVSKKLEELIESSEKEWAIYLEDTLHALSPDMVFPRMLYITASGDTAPLFMGFLRLPKTDSTSDFRKNVNIVYINEDTLTSFYQSESKAPEDEFVTIFSIFYNKLFQI